MAKRKQLKVVLDTSVLLSRERRALLFLAATNQYTLVWSDYIADEVKRKIMEIGWSRAKADELLNALVEVAELVDYRQIIGGNYTVWLRDPDDHPIMATALAGRVDYLVTWNTRDFPPKLSFAGITIITPDTFLQLFGVELA